MQNLQTSKLWKLKRSLHEECEKDYCKERYIGIKKTENSEKGSIHIGYVKNRRLDMTTGAHFNSPGHSTSNMKFTILEKVNLTDPLYGSEREKLLFRKFNTFYRGLNRTP